MTAATVLHEGRKKGSDAQSALPNHKDARKGDAWPGCSPIFKFTNFRMLSMCMMMMMHNSVLNLSSLCSCSQGVFIQAEQIRASQRNDIKKCVA